MDTAMRVQIAARGFVLKVKGALLALNAESAAITLDATLIPLIAGLASEADAVEVSRVATEAHLELSLVLKRPPFAVMATLKEELAANRPASKINVDWRALTEAQRILDEDVLSGPTLVRLITALGSIFEVQTVAAAVPLRLVK